MLSQGRKDSITKLALFSVSAKGVASRVSALGGKGGLAAAIKGNPPSGAASAAKKAFRESLAQGAKSIGKGSPIIAPKSKSLMGRMSDAIKRKLRGKSTVDFPKAMKRPSWQK